MGRYNTCPGSLLEIAMKRMLVRQSFTPHIGSKLRSLLTRVMRRCGLPTGSVKRYRPSLDRSAFWGLQPLEPRTLLSVGVEMQVSSASSSAYVADFDAHSVDTIIGGELTVDVYFTISEADLTADGASSYLDNLAAFTLNFIGSSESLDYEWDTNDALFGSAAFEDETLDPDNGDWLVNAGLFTSDSGFDNLNPAVEIRTGVYGWLVGSLTVDIPVDAVNNGSYVIALYDSDIATDDNSTNMIHTYAVLNSTPEIYANPDSVTGLTINTFDAATVAFDPAIEILSIDPATDYASIDITTTNVASGILTLDDFTLTFGDDEVESFSLTDGGTVISDWRSLVTLTQTGSEGAYVYTLTHLEDVITAFDNGDGNYVLTINDEGVTNSAGVAINDDVELIFTVDTTPPVVEVDTAYTTDTTPAITGTIDDTTSTTIQVTLTHQQLTSETQTVTATVNNQAGTWSIADNALAELKHGVYDIQMVATDELNQATDVTTLGALTILDDYDDPAQADPDDDLAANNVALGIHYQTNLSIHDIGEQDWKSFTLDSDGSIQIRAIIPNGETLQVDLYAAGDTVNPIATYISADGMIDQTLDSQLAGDYLIRISEVGNDAIVTKYTIAAGDASELILSEVVNRQIFYNDSDFDGDVGASVNDDEAIDTTIAALLPGETATAANYTSYVNGINGIMIDVQGLSPDTVLDASDFIFKVGNDDTPDDWAIADAPASVTVRELASGDARITIIWDDGSGVGLEDQWLQVTVLATGDVALAEDDVFYFGNNIGDVNTDRAVNATDVFAIWDNRNVSVTASTVYDLDKNGSIQAIDVFTAWEHRKGSTDSSTPKFIAVPVVGDALMLAAGTVVDDSDLISVNDAEVASITDAAIAYWQSVGTSESNLTLLSEVDVQVTNLSGNLLGLTVGKTIYIDADAAGVGWFVDRTPDENEEFTWSDLEQIWKANPEGEAANKVDLLTVLTHEYGHVLGLEHVEEPGNVMQETLMLGKRFVWDLSILD